MHIIKLTIIFLVVTILVGCNSQIPTDLLNESENSADIQTQIQNQQAQVVINFGDTQIEGSIDPVQSSTVLAALVAVAEEQSLEVYIEEYDFGSLVTTIGDSANGSENVWVYYLNDKPGNVGADQQQITSGDKIEWRYESFKESL